MGKVLVTGGTGFIGSHTVVELQQSGREVVIVDNLSNSKAEVVDRVAEITGVRAEFENFDLADRGATLSFFARHRGVIDAVIHFAAFKAVGESVQKPLEYYRNNLQSLMNVLEGMESTGVGSLVFSSSCTVYGQPELLPVTEQTPRREAESPYGNTKSVNEDIIRDYCHAHSGLRAIALRYFNPIGAHPSGLIGELPVGVPNNLVPFITQTAAGIRSELKVFGDDYDTPDGSPIRDYIDVVDLSRAHLAAIDRLESGRGSSNYEWFNVGTGRGLSVLELIGAFKRATGAPLPYKIVGRRAGDIVKIWADTSLANRELGWSARVPIEETLRNAWRWQQAVCGK